MKATDFRPSTNTSPLFLVRVAVSGGRNGQDRADVSLSHGRSKTSLMCLTPKLTTASYCMNCKTRQKAGCWTTYETHRTRKRRDAYSQIGSCARAYLRTINAPHGRTG